MRFHDIHKTQSGSCEWEGGTLGILISGASLSDTANGLLHGFFFLLLVDAVTGSMFWLLAKNQAQLDKLARHGTAPQVRQCFHHTQTVSASHVNH